MNSDQNQSRKSISLVKRVQEANEAILAPVDGSWIRMPVPARLPEIGQIRIGEQGKPRAKDGKTVGYIPKKLDHFAVYRVERGANGERIRHEEIHKVVGDRPKSIPVMFLFNDPLKNVYQYFGFYQGRRCACRGNGEVAVVQQSGNQRLCPCAYYDPEQNSGKCKPHTVVHCVLPFYNITGGIFTFRSTSIRTFNNFRAQLPFLLVATGGQIAGVEFSLKIQPFRTQQYGLAYSVHIEYPKSIYDLQGAALERAQLKAEWESQMKALRDASAGNIKLLEAPSEQAAICEEFSPETVDLPADEFEPPPEPEEKPEAEPESVEGEVVEEGGEEGEPAQGDLEKMWEQVEKEAEEFLEGQEE